MAARSGTEYLEGLTQSAIVYEIGGERHVGGVPDHPAFRNVTRSYAELFDMQVEPARRDAMTYVSPSSGDRVGMSFLEPRTVDDLVRRRTMMQSWAEHSMGMLGRTGDYLNSELVALSGAADYLGQAGSQYADNLRAYYEHVRENDLLLTHTLVNPQANRSLATWQQKDKFLAARILRETDSGVVVRGARLLATIGPISDEILVFPSTVYRVTEDDKPYALAFAIPCDTPGLRFICRETMDHGRSAYDHPLASRFEEPDAIVVFDDVEVPFERCFLLREPELCNRLYLDTGAVHHMTHQVVTRAIAKSEFFLGLVSMMTDAIQVEQFQHIQEKIAEIIVGLESMRALRHSAEQGAELNEWGVMTPALNPLNAARNTFPKLYQRFPEIVRQVGASGLMALPTESDVMGPAGDEIEHFLQSATLDGVERTRLFRLAWDASISAFAGRQELYEYFFFGDPVRMSGALLRSYDREPYVERVRRFLHRTPSPVDARERPAAAVEA